ncbi:hypothetical protein ACR6C2_16955 [Streptomyces sp. INA 01156]
MFGLIWLSIRLMWWMVGASIDITFYLLSLGKVDPKTRKMI